MPTVNVAPSMFTFNDDRGRLEDIETLRVSQTNTGMSRHHARFPDRLPRIVVCRVKPIAPSVHALLTLVLGSHFSAAITVQIFGLKEPASRGSDYRVQVVDGHGRESDVPTFGSDEARNRQLSHYHN